MTDAGVITDLLSLEAGEVQATNSAIYPADKFPVDRVSRTYRWTITTR